MRLPLRSIAVPVLLVSSTCLADEVLFQGGFAGKLGTGWTWVREEKPAWRVTDRGLEVRVLPGNLWGRANDARNVLVRPAPDTTQGKVEVSVTVTNRPSHQFEQADLAWYYDDSNMVKLGLELVSGEVCVVMGREEADKTRTLAKIPIAATSVRLRLYVVGNQIRGQYQPTGTSTWFDAATGELPAPPNAQAKISLHCYQGPPDAEHWARFSDFHCLATEPAKPAQPAPAKRPADDPAVEEKYRALVAKLPSEEQAWERTLQENLGSFYLPLHKRDKIKGVSNAWDFVKDHPKLPRVLLIGDSVSRGYTLAVRKVLAGKANVHRAPENCGGTANGLKKLDVWLGDGKWDVIHFNFGIHDRATPPAQYEERLEQIVARLQKTGAKLVWASTTPIPKDEAKNQTPGAVVECNAIAMRVMQKHGIAVDDLFSFITPQLATAQNPNDVHFNAKGYELLGAQVAEAIVVSFETNRR